MNKNNGIRTFFRGHVGIEQALSKPNLIKNKNVNLNSKK